MRETLNRKQS